MSADLLRRAAALMRERATEATSSPWHVEEEPWGNDEQYASSQQVRHDALDGTYSTAVVTHVWRHNSQHIASWHPAVALGVADWLDATADAYSACDCGLVDDDPHCEHSAPLALATTYLGETP